MSILKDLVSIDGASGFEKPVADCISSRLSRLSVGVRRDVMGNALASLRLGNGEPSLRLTFYAHMNEVGLMVKGVEPDGFIRFEKVGGYSRRLPSSDSCGSPRGGRFVTYAVDVISPVAKLPKEQFAKIARTLTVVVALCIVLPLALLRPVSLVYVTLIGYGFLGQSFPALTGVLFWRWATRAGRFFLHLKRKP